MRCSKHKTYKAKRRPSSKCDDCWRIWLSNNPDPTIAYKNRIWNLQWEKCSLWRTNIT